SATSSPRFAPAPTRPSAPARASARRFWWSGSPSRSVPACRRRWRCRQC
ncbi:uncharacterized protein METZ01_LOCUS468282, partial [marine metagenome]